MLDPRMEKCLLVRGWKRDAGWGFPRGKTSYGENDVECAIREVRGAGRGGPLRLQDGPAGAPRCQVPKRVECRHPSRVGHARRRTQRMGSATLLAPALL